MPALTTLAQIQTKVRRLSRSPSEAQLTTDQINEYINTFVLYDLPANIKLDFLSKTFTWWTQPNVDAYETNTLNVPELVDFKNRYICIDQPVYVNGNKVLYTQSRDQFFRLYPGVLPQTNQQLSNGTPNYAGILTTFPVERGSATFSMTDANGRGYEVHDDGVTGALIGDIAPGVNTINYATGAFDVTFAGIPAANTWVQSAVYAYTPGVPDTMLFYETKFILRPIPDAVYKVVMNVYLRPTAFLDAPADPSLQSPDLKEWAQYIAIGAARKVYEDRFDMESSAALMPIFKEQENLCLRRTLLQHRDQRAQTIFNESNSAGYWWNRWI
jgi:hypothetical protein